MPNAARLTDMHTCPMQTPGLPPVPHVGGPIIGPGVPTVLIGNFLQPLWATWLLALGRPTLSLKVQQQ